MTEKRRGLLATIGYGIIIIMLHYFLETNTIFFIFVYVPYVLGGEAVLAFFSGRLVQKMGNTKSIFGRICYTIIIGIALWVGCGILYSNPYRFEVKNFLASALNVSAHTLFMLTLPGFLIGQCYQFRKVNKT